MSINPVSPQSPTGPLHAPLQPEQPAPGQPGFFAQVDSATAPVGDGCEFSASSAFHPDPIAADIDPDAFDQMMQELGRSGAAPSGPGSSPTMTLPGGGATGPARNPGPSRTPPSGAA